MKIIIGLGNIGEKYKNTRHNAGFKALDFIVENFRKRGSTIKWKEESKLKAFTTRITYKNEILLLVKPTTFMNLSGESASKIINFFKEDIKNITVIYDDIDIPLGKIRIREKGSAGTHNGMKSIIQQLGTQEFKRIRIGIESRGDLTPAQQDIHSFVLNKFTNEEEKILEQVFEELKKDIIK